MGVEQEEEEVMASNVLEEWEAEREREEEEKKRGRRGDSYQPSLEELYRFWERLKTRIYLVEHSFV